MIKHLSKKCIHGWEIFPQHLLSVVIRPAIAKSRYRLPHSPLGFHSPKFSYHMPDYYKCRWNYSRSTPTVIVICTTLNGFVVFSFLFVFLKDHYIYVSHIVIIILYLFLQGLLYYTPLLVVVFELYWKILLLLFSFIYVIKEPVFKGGSVVKEEL